MKKNIEYQTWAKGEAALKENKKTIPDHNQCDPGLSFLNILP